MIFYKEDKTSDPYNELWNRDEWKHPLECADKMQFPLIVTLEPTNACPNRCLYCSRQLMNRKIGFMSLDIMERIAKECGENNAAIRHGGFGEPLVHPQVVELMRICKKHNVLTTIFSGCKGLTEDMMKEFVDMGLDEIRFSSSGITPDEHNYVRKNSDFYEDFDSRIKMAYDVRDKMGATKPFFTVYTNVIDYDSETFKNNIDKYKNEYLQYADKVDVDLTMFSRVKELEHVKPLYTEQTLTEKYKRCVTLFLKQIVHWNGDVFACDRAFNFEEDYYLGTLGKDNFTIEKGFKSKKMANLRKEVSYNLNHSKHKLCKDCYSNTTKWDFLYKNSNNNT